MFGHFTTLCMKGLNEQIVFTLNDSLFCFVSAPSVQSGNFSSLDGMLLLSCQLIIFLFVNFLCYFSLSLVLFGAYINNNEKGKIKMN